MPAAYCGPAPQPTTLWTSWNFDLVAITLALGALLLWLVRGAPGRGMQFTLGLGLWLCLFVTPFCALTVALFSARVAHHVLLISAVAPLLALAFPRRDKGPAALPVLVLVHAVTLWLWHAPAIYAEAILDGWSYWTMQLSLLGSAFLLWREIVHRARQPGPALLALLATVVQMGMLGALLTFAREPLYLPHLTTSGPFGLSPLADQQLGGLIMWVPAAAPYLVAAAWILGRRLGEPAMPSGVS